jgi:hypothetical protein
MTTKLLRSSFFFALMLMSLAIAGIGEQNLIMPVRNFIELLYFGHFISNRQDSG